jgi:tRNA G46 methylase TrmB
MWPVNLFLLRITAAAALELTGEIASVAIDIGHGNGDSLYRCARTSNDRNTAATAT